MIDAIPWPLAASALDLPAAAVTKTEPSRPSSPNLGTLRGLFGAYRGRLLLTYGLFNLENLLRLAQPYVLGWAIDDLLRGTYLGLLVLVIQHLSHLVIGICRQVYDIRAFTSIYTDLATRLVLGHRRGGVAVSCVAARSALSREFVSFFERDVPVVVFAVYSVVGSLVMLGLYDGLLVPACLALLLPVGLFNRVYGRKTLWLNQRLNDEFEREVEVIGRGQEPEVRGHYRRVGHWRIKLCDWEAGNAGATELFILGLIVVVLARSCAVAGLEAGTIFAMFRYVLTFISGLNVVPALVQQASRLCDIGRRMRDQEPAAVR